MNGPGQAGRASDRKSGQVVGGRVGRALTLTFGPPPQPSDLLILAGTKSALSDYQPLAPPNQR